MSKTDFPPNPNSSGVCSAPTHIPAGTRAGWRPREAPPGTRRPQPTLVHTRCRAPLPVLSSSRYCYGKGGEWRLFNFLLRMFQTPTKTEKMVKSSRLKNCQLSAHVKKDSGMPPPARLHRHSLEKHTLDQALPVTLYVRPAQSSQGCSHQKEKPPSSVAIRAPSSFPQTPQDGGKREQASPASPRPPPGVSPPPPQASPAARGPSAPRTGPLASFPKLRPLLAQCPPGPSRPPQAPPGAPSACPPARGAVPRAGPQASCRDLPAAGGAYRSPLSPN